VDTVKYEPTTDYYCDSVLGVNGAAVNRAPTTDY